VSLFEVGKPAVAEIWRLLALILRYLMPDLLGFLEEDIASNDTARLLVDLLMPIIEDSFENWPLRLALTRSYRAGF
jgi:hypothetical protein